MLGNFGQGHSEVEVGAGHNSVSDDILVSRANYFNDSVQNSSFLHFFQENSRYLFVYYLHGDNKKWSKYQLASTELVPWYHR
jgi:hypothetical protein